jgi:hypothetical protein
VVPSFVLLFRLASSGRLGQTLADTAVVTSAGMRSRASEEPRHRGLLIAIVMALVAVRGVRRRRSASR